MPSYAETNIDDILPCYASERDKTRDMMNCLDTVWPSSLINIYRSSCHTFCIVEEHEIVSPKKQNNTISINFKSMDYSKAGANKLWRFLHDYLLRPRILHSVFLHHPNINILLKSIIAQAQITIQNS